MWGVGGWSSGWKKGWDLKARGLERISEWYTPPLLNPHLTRTTRLTLFSPHFFHTTQVLPLLITCLNATDWALR